MVDEIQEWDDFNKRVKDELGLDPQNTTFPQFLDHAIALKKTAEVWRAVAEHWEDAAKKWEAAAVKSQALAERAIKEWKESNASIEAALKTKVVERKKKSGWWF